MKRQSRKVSLAPFQPTEKLTAPQMVARHKSRLNGHPRRRRSVCTGGLVILPGGGKPEFELPTVAGLVSAANAFIHEHWTISPPAKEVLSDRDDQIDVCARIPELPNARFGCLLELGAAGLQQEIVSGANLPALDQRFTALAEGIDWALSGSNMPESYRPGVESLRVQLRRVRALYDAALTRLNAALRSLYPFLPEHEREELATTAIDSQLEEPIYVLHAWGEALIQARNPAFPEVHQVRIAMQEAFDLLITGDADGVPSPERSPVRTTNFTVGARYCPWFCATGPSVMSGHGPDGLNAVQIPMNEKKRILLWLLLEYHELGHTVAADLKGFYDDVMAKVSGALSRGQAPLTRPKVKFGRFAFDTADVIQKYWSDTTSEWIADVIGILLAGPAWAYSMIQSFCAMNAPDDQSLVTAESGRLFRDHGYYALTVDNAGNKLFDFEEHPPDFFRALCAAALVERLGFADDAAEIRWQAERLMKGRPVSIRWRDIDGTSNNVLEIALADLLPTIDVVLDELLGSTFDSLGDSKLTDFVTWDAKREGKARAIADHAARNRNADLPAGIGRVHSTTVVSGTLYTYLELLRRGERVPQAMAIANAIGLELLEKIRQRKEPDVMPMQEPTVADDATGSGAA